MLRNIKFYYKYPVTSLYEARALKDLGVCYILTGTPLLFNLKALSRYDIPLRAIPNLAYEPYLKHKNGIIGGWIRPEDTDKYGEYISVFEFYAPKALDKESALYHVYAENKYWPGNLNLLIENLDFDFDNRILYDEEGFATRRMNCQQKCLQGKSCHYCEDQFYFVDRILKKYRDNKNTN